MNFANTIAAIGEIAQSRLPGEEAHKDLMPINRPFTSQLRLDASDYRQSAVAMVLYEQDDTLMSILIQRPTYNGVHSHQIAFPGGKRDVTDPNIEFTARLETMEEVAIPIDSMDLLGKLTEVYIPTSKFIVSPHIFAIDSLPDLIPDEREVEEIIPFKVDRLLDKDSIQHTDIKFGNGLIQKQVPYFSINDRVVWGATGMILSEFRSILREL